MSSRYIRREVLLSLVSLVIVLVSGCLPGRVPLGTQNRPSPALKWVFDAGSDLCLLLGFYPSVDRVDVLAGAHHGDRLILVCGSSCAEVALPAKVFLLDVESGRVLRQIVGPFDNSVWNCTITADRFYFTHWRPGDREGTQRWGAFNLNTGGIEWNVSKPDPQAVICGPYANTSLSLVRPAQIVGDKVELEYRLASNKSMHIAREKAGLADWTVFTMAWEDVGHRVHRMPLCRLNNPGNAPTALLLQDDEHLLLFTWGNYVICVDATRIPPATTPGEL
jgi:hypothetical protein